jgi:hypothetical protein
MANLHAPTERRSWLGLAGLVLCGWLFGLVVGWLAVGLLGAALWPLPVCQVLGIVLAVALWLRRGGRTAAARGPSALADAVTYGMVGAAIGFGAVLVWSAIKDANQGPLLGIFVTGPLGFFLGGSHGRADSVPAD